MTTKPLIQNAALDCAALQQTIETRLQSRLSEPNYSVDEIATVSSKDCRLFPKSFFLTEELTNSFRALCNLSQTKLRPARQITSHRKIVGPMIVALKKLSFPIIKIHLDDTFKGIEQFCSWMVHSYAKEVVLSASLKDELAKHK